ncbi:MAG: helix-turn-helix domain-containing protein [Gemmataceae bacterium]|nr:helix-turn-helix domain-containing protein [Gemmataceae bacterium]
MASAKTKAKDRNGVATTSGEVLTLPEVAAYLRVDEKEIPALVEHDALPARRIGNDWRFLKSAVNHWLQSGTSPEPRPGTKEAIMPFFGIFKDEDVNEFLDTLGKLRKSME